MKEILKFNFHGKKLTIRNYEICADIFSQIRGLMFRSKNYSKSLLFVWKKPSKRAIHSFFCGKFFAIWMLKGKVIDAKMILPWKWSVTPKSKFDELLEIPENSDDFRNI